MPLANHKERPMRSGDAEVRYVNPPSLERPPGYSHVADVRGGRLIFVAGQAGVDRAALSSAARKTGRYRPSREDKALAPDGRSGSRVGF
jgi:hypothetical protein